MNNSPDTTTPAIPPTTKSALKMLNMTAANLKLEIWDHHKLLPTHQHCQECKSRSMHEWSRHNHKQESPKQPKFFLPIQDQRRNNNDRFSPSLKSTLDDYRKSFLLRSLLIELLTGLKPKSWMTRIWSFWCNSSFKLREREKYEERIIQSIVASLKCLIFINFVH